METHLARPWSRKYKPWLGRELGCGMDRVCGSGAGRAHLRRNLEIGCCVCRGDHIRLATGCGIQVRSGG